MTQTKQNLLNTFYIPVIPTGKRNLLKNKKSGLRANIPLRKTKTLSSEYE